MRRVRRRMENRSGERELGAIAPIANTSILGNQISCNMVLVMIQISILSSVTKRTKHFIVLFPYYCILLYNFSQ